MANTADTALDSTGGKKNLLTDNHPRFTVGATHFKKPFRGTLNRYTRRTNQLSNTYNACKSNVSENSSDDLYGWLFSYAGQYRLLCRR